MNYLIFSPAVDNPKRRETGVLQALGRPDFLLQSRHVSYGKKRHLSKQLWKRERNIFGFGYYIIFMWKPISSYDLGQEKSHILCSCLCCSIHTICKHPTYAFKEQRKNPIVTKNPPSLPSTPTGRTNGDPKISLILYKFEFSGDFCPSGEAGYWERCRTRGVCGEDGLDQEVMLEGIYNSKSHGQR